MPYLLVIIILCVSGMVAPGALAEELPLDILKKTCAPYLPPEDSLAFPIKLRYMSGHPHDLWGGGKVLFFRWCKDNVADWMADKEAYVVQHGDQHVTNIGTYASAGKFGRVSFGLIDYDDTQRLPFQIELLQCVIALRLVAGQAHVNITDAQMSELIGILVDNYGAAANSGPSPTQMLTRDPMVQKLLKHATKSTYGQELEKYTTNQGRFCHLITTPDNRPLEILQPAMNRADELAAGIAQAIGRSEDLKRTFRIQTPEDVRKAIKDIVLRIHLGGAGSQSQHKYLILLASPFQKTQTDIILYAKEQIPSSPERVGLVEFDGRPLGQRRVEDVLSLSVPPPFICSWFNLGKESYVLTLHEPWSKELSPADVPDFEALQRMARFWGIAAGASHRQPGQPAMIKGRLNARLNADLARLSSSYLVRLQEDFDQLKADPRTTALTFAAKKTIASMAAKARGE